MDVETARILLGSIATVTQLAMENQNKLMAVEAALQKCEPQLFQAYLESLKEVRRNSPIASDVSRSRQHLLTTNDEPYAFDWHVLGLVRYKRNEGYLRLSSNRVNSGASLYSV